MGRLGSVGGGGTARVRASGHVPDAARSRERPLPGGERLVEVLALGLALDVPVHHGVERLAGRVGQAVEVGGGPRGGHKRH